MLFFFFNRKLNAFRPIVIKIVLKSKIEKPSFEWTQKINQQVSIGIILDNYYGYYKVEFILKFATVQD